MDNLINVSIIIPTHNRIRQLLKCLNVLNSQTYCASYFEVIVVADSCTDGTEYNVINFSRESRYSLKILKHNGRKASISRNIGIKAAKGDILLFMDDDVLPSRQFIDEHIKAHKNSDVVIGYLETILPTNPGYWQLKARLWWESRFEEMGEPGHIFSFRDLFTGNVSIKSSFIKTVGMFNENLNRLEDYELGYRLIKASARFGFSRSAGGKHFETNNMYQWAERIVDDGYANCIMGNLYPELRENLFANVLDVNGNNLLKNLAFIKFKYDGYLVQLLLLMAQCFEYISARGMWQICIGVIDRFNYWRGVAQHFNTKDEFNKWVTEIPYKNCFSYDNYEYDLKRKSSEIRDEELELINKKGLRIKYGKIELYNYINYPGYEKLRKGHINYIRHFHYDADLCRKTISWESLLHSTFNKPARVLDIDITKPLYSIEVESKYNFAVLNIMIGNKPAGYLTFNCTKEKIISKESIYFEVQRYYSNELKKHLLVSSLKDFTKHATEVLPISVIVCTRNRSENLKRCLKSLQEIDYTDYEVIVVDNCPEDNSTFEAAKYFGFMYVREERPGLNHARNAGIKASRNEIVAYIDDDAVASKGWLRGIAEGFSDNKVSAVTGMVLPAELETENQLDFEFYGGMNKGFNPFFVRFNDLDISQKFWASAWGIGTNMAFRKEIFNKVSNFNITLDVGTPTAGGGDLEFFYRVVSAGYNLKYEPSALIKHYHRREKNELLKQIYNNGKSFPAYLLSIAEMNPEFKKHIYWFAFRWWLFEWLVKRFFLSLIWFDKRTFAFVIAEIKGCMLSFNAYQKSRKLVRKMI